ncbi:hypothetical protein ACVWWD_006301 [Mesorhizobium sp. URHB0026]
MADLNWGQIDGPRSQERTVRPWHGEGSLRPIDRLVSHNVSMNNPPATGRLRRKSEMRRGNLAGSFAPHIRSPSIPRQSWKLCRLAVILVDLTSSPADGHVKSASPMRFSQACATDQSRKAMLSNGAVMDRKLAAILAADVVGYSALMEQDEQGTFERLKAGRRELIAPEIARHHGRVFKFLGDGLLAEFSSVVDVVECDVALQRGLAERNAAAPEDQRFQVRIGVNLGEVIVEGDDCCGEGVNIAARLEQIAEPGHRVGLLSHQS